VSYGLITSALHPLCALLLTFRLGTSHVPMFFVTTVNNVIFEIKAQCFFCEVITELFNVMLKTFRLLVVKIQATSWYCSLHCYRLPKRSKDPDVRCYRDPLVIHSNVQHKCPISFCLYLTSGTWRQTDISDSKLYRVLLVVCRLQTSIMWLYRRCRECTDLINDTLNGMRWRNGSWEICPVQRR